MIYGNISRELLLMTDELDDSKIKLLKDRLGLGDDVEEKEILNHEIEIISDLIDDETKEMIEIENVDRIVIVF